MNFGELENAFQVFSSTIIDIMIFIENIKIFEI